MEQDSELFTLQQIILTFYKKSAMLDSLTSPVMEFLCGLAIACVLYYFESCNLEKATDFLSATEILKFFADDIKIPITEAAAQRLGRELKKHGFLKLKRKDRTVYALRKKDFETVRHQKHYSTTIDEVVTG